ncbi:hypothetical protein YC2023_066333 [Brassica napus]
MTGTQLLDELAQAVRSLVQLYQLNYVRLDPRKGLLELEIRDLWEIRHTQDVRGCRSAHTGRSCVSVSIHRTSVAVRVCPSAHTGRLWLSISSHISMLVLGLCTLALPVDCLGDFGPRGLSVQYTQDVRGCPPAHTGRPWRSVCVRQHTQDVHGCPSVYISARCTHGTSEAVRQHKQDVRVCPSAHTGRSWLCVCVCQHTHDVCGCPSVHISARWMSVGVRQHTEDVHGCLWLSVSTHRTSVCVRVCLSAHTGRPWVSASTHRTSVGVRQHTQDIRVCPCVSVSTHRTTHISMLVLGLRTLTLLVDCSGDFGPRGLSVQYTQDVRGYPPAHTGRLWLSVCVRLCPSTHTGRPWLSLSTHISTLVLGLSMLALPVDCLGDFVPSGLSVQYTQDVHGCLPAHTGRPGLFVALCQHTQDIRVCPGVSVSTHRTFVGVAHTGRLWLSISTHISTVVLGLCTLALPVDCLGDFGPRGLSVQYTQDVRGCPPAHTGRPWRTLVLGLSTLALPVDCLGDFGPRGLSVQNTQDVCGCPTHMTSVAVHPYTYQHVCPLTPHADPSCGLFGTSVAVRVCPSVSVSTHRTSVAVPQYTYQHVGPWTQHAGPSRGLFG